MNRLSSAHLPVQARGPKRHVLAMALVGVLALAGCGDKTEPELIAGAKVSIEKSEIEAAKV